LQILHNTRTDYRLPCVVHTDTELCEFKRQLKTCLFGVADTAAHWDFIFNSWSTFVA